MGFRIISMISGSGTPVHRLYNAGCLVAMIFCMLSAVESGLIGLSWVLIAANVLYSITLAFLYYLSRVKLQHGASRILGIVLLVFIYTPVLWFNNGGSSSGIPYFIVMFVSFLVILTIDENNSRRERIFSVAVFATNLLVVTGLIYAEYAHPEKVYVFPSRSTQYFDMAAGMIFAVFGNFFILKTFVVQHYKDLDEIKKYSKMLEELVQIDSMTGLLNHSHLLTRLDAEIEKSSRYDRPLSLLMLDLDYFKRINDAHGHQFGDEVLIAVASLIKKCSRTVDVPARYGGEEFILVLPETNAKSALVVAQRLRSNLRDMSLSIPVSVTVSGGIVEYVSGDSAHEMIKRADVLLYQAKENGRNRIYSNNLQLI